MMISSNDGQLEIEQPEILSVPHQGLIHELAVLNIGSNTICRWRQTFLSCSSCVIDCLKCRRSVPQKHVKRFKSKPKDKYWSKEQVIKTRLLVVTRISYQNQVWLQGEQKCNLEWNVIKCQDAQGITFNHICRNCWFSVF